jgi:hypothetical protein
VSDALPERLKRAETTQSGGSLASPFFPRSATEIKDMDIHGKAGPELACVSVFVSGQNIVDLEHRFDGFLVAEPEDIVRGLAARGAEVHRGGIHQVQRKQAHTDRVGGPSAEVLYGGFRRPRRPQAARIDS